MCGESTSKLTLYTERLPLTWICQKKSLWKPAPYHERKIKSRRGFTYHLPENYLLREESSLFPIHLSVLQLKLKKLPSLAPCHLDVGRAERRAGLHNKQGARRTAEEPGTLCSTNFTGSNLKGISKHRVSGVGTTVKSTRKGGEEDAGGQPPPHPVNHRVWRKPRNTE